MKKILITGGAGYIGSHTCLLLLEKGIDIVVIDSLVNSSQNSIKRISNLLSNHKKKGKLKFELGDIRDNKKLNQIFNFEYNSGKPIDGVIHFAGLKSVVESLSLPLSYWDVNVNGTINVIRSMQQFGCKNIVFSSSATLYGIVESKKIKETDLINPTNPYGNTKYAIEKLLNDLYNSDKKNWKIACLRYFNPIGAHTTGELGEAPQLNCNNIFPKVLNVASGEMNHLEVLGKDWPTKDGTGVRDYIHVLDLAEGHIAAIDYLQKNKPQFICLNLGTGKGTSVLDLIETFKKVNNIDIPFIFKSRRSGDVPYMVADNSLALSKLDWYPFRNIKDMCIDGWKWKKNNPNGYESIY